jgi:hypothetical protein
MALRIAGEVLLATLTFFLGGTLWQLHKRKAFVKWASARQPFLNGLLSREMLADPPPQLEPYLAKNKIGYFINLTNVVSAERRSQRVPWIIAFCALLLVLSGSFYLGSTYLAINVALICFLGFQPISEAAKRNACEHILTMAAILYRWHADDSGECDEWVAHVPSLTTLYRAVVTASSSSN